MRDGATRPPLHPTSAAIPRHAPPIASGPGDLVQVVQGEGEGEGSRDGERSRVGVGSWEQPGAIRPTDQDRGRDVAFLRHRIATIHLDQPTEA